MSTLERIQTRLEKDKNCLPPEVLQRLQKALTEGIDAEKCGSFLSEIEEIHRQLETAGGFVFSIFISIVFLLYFLMKFNLRTLIFVAES